MYLKRLWPSNLLTLLMCDYIFHLIIFFLVPSVEIPKSSGAVFFLAKREGLFHCRSPARALLRLLGGQPLHRRRAWRGANPLQQK